MGSNSRRYTIWKIVGEGKSLSELKVTDFTQRIGAGQKVYVEMRLKSYFGVSPEVIARAFDLPGTEAAFASSSKIPPGMALVDVYGEGDHGVVVLQATEGIGALPAVAVVAAFIATNWLRISLTILAISVVLAAVVIGVRLLLWVAGAFGGASTGVILGLVAAGIIGYVLLTRRRT